MYIFSKTTRAFTHDNAMPNNMLGDFAATTPVIPQITSIKIRYAIYDFNNKLTNKFPFKPCPIKYRNMIKASQIEKIKNSPYNYRELWIPSLIHIFTSAGS